MVHLLAVSLLWPPTSQFVEKMLHSTVDFLPGGSELAFAPGKLNAFYIMDHFRRSSSSSVARLPSVLEC